jgi:membrane-bound metal-dependent hydrolase YbcI (DUF457 family)
LLGKLSAKPLNVKPNVPVLLVLSIIPDIDILVGVEAFHRGPTHSLITAALVFLPFFILYRRRAIPYFLALVSHGLIGDLFVGGNIQLFWPLLSSPVFLPSPPFLEISIFSTLNVTIESTLFVVATIVLVKTKDFLLFFRSKLSNLVLAIPIFTVLLPTFVGYPLSVPFLLVPTHLFYLVLFSIAVLIWFFRRLRSL